MARRNPKERLKGSLPAFTMVCFGLAVGGILLQLDSLSPGRLDSQGSRVIRRQCAGQAPCTVRLGDLFPGAWDSFYEFSPGVPQAELNQVLRQTAVHTAPYQRVLILLKDGKIQRRQYAHTGAGQPLPGELVFAATDPRQGWVVYTPEAQFRVRACDTFVGGAVHGTPAGTFYVLTPVLAAAAPARPCWLPGGRPA